ncbi:methyl-accepting chemotaxis sensory transducer [gamma proteobacterium HTCC5015]|nr:methyl-accepting chemotaxis sensory transducer [gamma proteobacterium HTCC5015]
MALNADVLKNVSGKLKLGSNWLLSSLAVLMVVFIIASISMFLINATQSRYSSEYVRYVGEQELITQQIATSALEAAAGKPEAFNNLIDLRQRFDETLTYLQEGNPETGLPPLDETEQLSNLASEWGDYRRQVTTIIDGRELIGQVASYVENVNEILPQLLAFSDEVANEIVKANGDQQSVYIASRQLLLAQRIQNNLNRILSGDEAAATAADQFGRDAAFFGRVLEGMLVGYEALGIKAVTIPAALDRLEEAEFLFADVSENVSAILDASSQLFDIRDATSNVQAQSPTILAAGGQLREMIASEGDAESQLYSYAGFVLLAVAVAIMFGIAMLLRGQASSRAEKADEQNRQNQQAILRLLDEMTHLAEGDLTAYATVTEDITGAIADSMNYSIDALRSLVETINQTVVEVSSSSEQTQAITSRLQESSAKQAEEITKATTQINNMSKTMEEMSSRADESAEVALKSIDIANKGAEMVRKNIEGMDTVRDAIQETSKRIKRLGESSQQIGEIVALITDIADQTNILALNAAIQASSAGEAGRGFAVVADEVQRLAERAGNATKQISALVKTIQADTNEAVSSMEASTSGVVNGAKLAEDAGVSLVEVESVSKELADLIQNISSEASDQALSARTISQIMNVIQAITMETSESTNETAKSVGQMTELANELRKSVAGFKLPETDEVDTVMLR